MYCLKAQAPADRRLVRIAVPLVSPELFLTDHTLNFSSGLSLSESLLSNLKSFVFRSYIHIYSLLALHHGQNQGGLSFPSPLLSAG